MTRRARDGTSVHLQRASLSKAERAELRRLLAIAPEGNALPPVAAAHHGALGVADAIDRQLIERAATAALAQVHGLMPTVAAPRTLVPLAVSAASVLGVAGLMMLWLQASPQSAESRARAPTLQADTIELPLEQTSGLLAQAASEREEVVKLAAAVSGMGAAREPHAVKAAEAVVTAAELFRRANAARRAGDDTRAQRGYRRLLAGYPLSAEASPASVSLAKLLLARGAPAEADRVLTRYFARDGGSRQLDEEALVIHGKVLRALGEVKRERSSWRELLQRHPSGVYAGLATQRLAALEYASGHVDP